MSCPFDIDEDPLFEPEGDLYEEVKPAEPDDPSRPLWQRDTMMHNEEKI